MMTTSDRLYATTAPVSAFNLIGSENVNFITEVSVTCVVSFALSAIMQPSIATTNFSLQQPTFIMKKKFAFPAVFLVSAILIGITVFSTSKNEVNVLVFSKTAGYRHASIEPGIEAVKQLGKQQGFQVEATEDASVFTERKLKDFEVVMFLNTTGDILDQEQQTQLERFIRAGGGFVGVHAAADTEYDWPWYGKLVGGYFNGHPNDPNVREATLDIVDAGHAATEPLPSHWTRSDEWYNYKTLNEANNVLINIDESTYEGGTNGDHHPMSWYKEYDGGRAFYTGLGHTPESYTDSLYLAHLAGGIQYAIGAGVPVDYARVSTTTAEENE